jgi:hypothetical protein
VWARFSVPTLPIFFDYSHFVQGVMAGRLRSFESHDLKFSGSESVCFLLLCEGRVLTNKSFN